MFLSVPVLCLLTCLLHCTMVMSNVSNLQTVAKVSHYHRRHHQPSSVGKLQSAETGDVLFKSQLYDPKQLELLTMKDADFAVYSVLDTPAMQTGTHATRHRTGGRRPDNSRHRHHRQKRRSNETNGASLHSSYTVESSLHILDVYPRQAKVTFKMMSSHDHSERLNIDNLDYGSHYQSWSQLSLSDKFNAEARFEAGFKEVYEDQISATTLYTKVPHTTPDELLVVVDGNISLSLHASVFPFSNREMRIPEGKGWAYVYNALIPQTESAREGLDIIVYAPQHFKNNLHPLLRLGYNIPLNNGTEVVLPEGHYQLKVARRGSIVDICDFQATLSFIPPTCIRIRQDTHQYLVLHGIIQQFASAYPPDLMMVPENMCVAAEENERKVAVYFLNAYQAPASQFNHPVTFSFPNLYYSVSLKPHSAEYKEMSLHDGDCYKVHTKGQTTNPPPVQVDSADRTLCVFLVDNNMYNGHIDAFHHCWAKYDYLAPQAAWIFTYNTLDRNFPPLDVIVFQIDGGMDDVPWMYKIMHNATVGEGMPALLDAHTYIVKTFPAYTVSTPEEFFSTPSLTEVSVIDFKPRSYHFNVLYGGRIETDGSLHTHGKVLLEPPSDINATKWLLQHISNQSMSTATPATTSISAATSLSPTTTSTGNRGNLLVMMLLLAHAVLVVR